MKNVLVISSSPRRGGNSDALADEFLKGALKSGKAAEKIFLADKKIAYCTGCGACGSTGTCVINDDMRKILDKMIEADVIVLATPVYFYSMCAQLKTLIDRTVPKYNDIAGKEFYFILTAADTDARMMSRTLEALRGFTEDCLPASKECGVIMGLGVWRKGEIEGNPALKEAYEAGLNA